MCQLYYSVTKLEKWGCNIMDYSVIVTYRFGLCDVIRSPCSATLNETCRMITGCLKPTNTNRLPVLAGIAPSYTRRAVASRTERIRQTTDKRHPLDGHLGVVPLLESRKSFIKCSEPFNTTATAVRLELWRERFEALGASVC